MKYGSHPAAPRINYRACIVRYREKTNRLNARTIAVVAGLGAALVACLALVSAARADALVEPGATLLDLAPRPGIVVLTADVAGPDAFEDLIAALIERASVSQPAASEASVVTNGPVPDTPTNRAAYGQPLSRAGQASPPLGD
jgi:hypothetical protein